MAASTVGRSYTHTSAQCSPASVGLAQARPNYSLAMQALNKLAHDHTNEIRVLWQ